MENDVTAGMSSGMMTGIIVFYVAILVLIGAAMWKIFEKAGKPGWAALIPIYNLVVYLEIIGKPLWWFLLLFVPLVNFVIAIWMVNLLSKSFGKDAGFTIGLIFLPFIFYPVLAFGSARYMGPAGQTLNYAGKELPLV